MRSGTRYPDGNLVWLFEKEREKEKKSMKYLIACSIMVLVFMLAIPVRVGQAQDNQPVMDSAQKAAVRDKVQALGEIFGVESPKKQEVKSGAEERKPEEKKKTLPEVADKALDMVANAVGAIAAELQKVAPEVLRIMVKQQYARAIADPLVPFGMLMIVLIVERLLKKNWPDQPDTKESHEAYWTQIWFKNVLPMVFGILFTIWLVGSLAVSVKIGINPEYYAIKDLLTIVLKLGL